MEGQDSGSGKTSFRCSFCGCDDRSELKEQALGREHVAVVVACVSCGRQFAVLSAN